MLAGRRAFTGDSSAEIMAAILKQEPPELPESVPALMRHIVARCLEKDPANRFQSARRFGVRAGAEPSNGFGHGSHSDYRDEARAGYGCPGPCDRLPGDWFGAYHSASAWRAVLPLNLRGTSSPR